MAQRLIRVDSKDVLYGENSITSFIAYNHTEVTRDAQDIIHVAPKVTRFAFTTETTVPKLGLMMVGLGGNNGTTVTAGIIANREGITWRTRNGVQKPNFFGSITQASTIRIGFDAENNQINIPMTDIVPMVRPVDLEIGGWDISSFDLARGMERSRVLEPDLQRQLAPVMSKMVPLPAIYDENFIAGNQKERADNILPPTMPKLEQVARIKADIEAFKADRGLDSVVVVWTATTERFCKLTAGVHDTAENLLAAIAANHAEVSPSTLYAVATIQAGCSYINGAPQNTLVPGVVQLAERAGVFVGGDDFKSGQTKFKSVITDFLISAGIKVTGIVSYNHLGNNDGRNLSSEAQFKSKELTKANVVDDLVASNSILYPDPKADAPDHVVVIKYVPVVGDSKRALDEYTSEIFMGGTNTIVCHNTCEDSLLAAPLILDLAILTELFSRVRISRMYPDSSLTAPEPLHTVLAPLSYLLKAPMVPQNTPVINALFRQRACIENILRALVGLPADDNTLLEFKLPKCEKQDVLAGCAEDKAVAGADLAAAAAAASR